MKQLITLTLLGATLLGCASDQAQLQTSRTYVVEWIGERPLIDRSHLTLTLDVDGRAYGSGGCNHWFGSYQLDGENLSFGPLGSTRKMCAEALMEQEQHYFEALSEVQRWDTSATQQLQLWPATGKPLRLWPEEG